MEVGLAVYAAVLSTITALWEITSFWRSRARLHIEVGLYRMLNTAPIKLPKHYPSPQDCKIGIVATNVGGSALTVSELRVELKSPREINGKTHTELTISDPKLPKILLPGESITIYAPGDGSQLKGIRRVIMCDSTEKKWDSLKKPIPMMVFGLVKCRLRNK